MSREWARATSANRSFQRRGAARPLVSAPLAWSERSRLTNSYISCSIDRVRSRLELRQAGVSRVAGGALPPSPKCRQPPEELGAVEGALGLSPK